MTIRLKPYFLATASVCLILLSCPLMTPAPHYHLYKPIETSDVDNIEVFCTPGNKTFHLFYSKDSKIEVCSKVFESDDCLVFEHGLFFEKEKYQKTIRMKDGRFHRLFFSDTLRLSINNSNKKEVFIPVE